MLARTLLAPAELPVGIITALMGHPSSSGSWSRAAGRCNRRTSPCLDPPLVCRELSLRLGNRLILDRLDLELQAGGLTALLGPEWRRKKLAAQMPDRRAGT